MGIPLCVICCFSLAAFNICSLCLNFVNLINMCLRGFTLGLSCLGFSGFLGLGWLFPSHFREAFNYYLLKYFLRPVLFVFFWDSYDSNVGAFDIVPEVSEVVLISFNIFSSFSTLLHLFPPFYLPFHLSYLLLQYSTVGPLQSAFDLLFHYSLLIDSSLFLLGPC